MNSTSNSSSADIIPLELRAYRYTELTSAIILCILSPITVTSNVLLLTAIYRDPYRCFRTPMTFFIVALAVTDLLTGIFVEPMFASYYFADFADFTKDPSASYQLVYRIGGIISTVTITDSFFIVLALSVCQYIAVTYPHQFKAIVTRNRVLIFLTVSSVYITCFCMLQFTGIDQTAYLKIDLILHPTIISAVLLIVQFVLFSSFNRYLKNSSSLRGKVNSLIKRDRDSFKRRHSERQFTVMTFYLTAILLASSSLHIVVLYIYLFKTQSTLIERRNIFIGIRISDLMLFIKVAMDIFIYAWRLPSYRRALRSTLCGRQAGTHSCFYRKPTDGVSPEQLNELDSPSTKTARV